MNKGQLVGLLGFMMAANHGVRFLPTQREVEHKRCLNCGESHIHHNSFCSADCCRAHNKRMKDTF